jgi:hypothetical protein
VSSIVLHRYPIRGISYGKCSAEVRRSLAGAEGFEPPKAVLETAGLPLAYAPSKDVSWSLNRLAESAKPPFDDGSASHFKAYFVSRCG